MDVASGERDSLAEKAAGLKTQLQEATEALENMQVDLTNKVRPFVMHELRSLMNILV